MSIDSFMATILVLAALLFIGMVVLTIKVARRHTTKAWVGIAIALPVLLLSLEQFASIGWSYDILARTSFHPYVPEAPIMALYGMLLLGFGAAIVVCLAAVIAIATVTWRRAPSRRLALILACLPAGLLYILQYQQVLREEGEGYRQAQEQDVRNVSECRRQAAAAGVGCRNFIQTFAGESDVNLTADGRNWAFRHHAKSELDCRTIWADYDQRPAFTAGCRAAVVDLNHQLGKNWASDHKLDDPEDCRQGAQKSELPTDFLEGCAKGVHERLSGEGYGWAKTQFVFDAAKCRSRLPGTKPNADFVAGCESFVRGLATSTDSFWQGVRFVTTRHIQDAAQCDTSFPDAPPDFNKGCRYEVHVEAASRNSRDRVPSCNNEHFGATAAHVVVPPAARASFIRYVEVIQYEEGRFPDHQFELKYNGGAGYMKSVTLDLSDVRSGNINVVMLGKAPGSEFFAWVQTCNTNLSWKPYWKTFIRALRKFPEATVTETAFKHSDIDNAEW